MRAKLLVLCAVLLAGCQAGLEEPAPPPKTPQEVLEEQRVDDTHDAFLVDTGGRMGTLLVTTELGDERGEFEVSMRLYVWNPADMSQPMQTQDWTTLCFKEHNVLDVNFDGYQDFTYLYAQGIQVRKYRCMVWNEEQGLFVEQPEYVDIPDPAPVPEAEAIYGWARSSAAGDGWTPIYQWVDGELVCVRDIEVSLKDWRDRDNLIMVLTVKDRIDGELTEVFRTEFPAGSEDYFDERIKWEDLSYHGETEETEKENSNE